MLQEYSKTYKPFIYPWAVEIAKTHEKIHWVEDEVSLNSDITDWSRGKLTQDEKAFITNILRLFTQSDVIVGKFYYENLIPRFKNNEVRNMLGSFAAREAIHQRAYALLNDTLGIPESEYLAFLEYVEMADKADFMYRADTSTDHGLALGLAKSVFNEGVSLFASFAMLLNFQRRGLMIGTGKIVEWSIRDESMHVDGISRLFRQLFEERPNLMTNQLKSDIYTMAEEMVRVEEKFIDLAFQDYHIEGMPMEDIKQYVRHIADRRLIQLGMKPIFKVKDNPIMWLEYIVNGLDHTNFFENRVTDYSVGGMTGDWCFDG